MMQFTSHTRARALILVGLLAGPCFAACSSNDDAPSVPTDSGAHEAGSSVDASSLGDGSLDVSVAESGADAAPDSTSFDERGAVDVVDAGKVEAEAAAPTAVDAEAGSVGTDARSDAATGLEHAPAYPTVTFPPENPFTADKAMLGKILFWEEQIGDMDDMACGTCHRAQAGGSDPRASEAASLIPGPDGVLGTADDVRGARGVIACNHATHMNVAEAGTTHQVTGRKPPSYLDAMFYPALFWDGRASGPFYDPLDVTHSKSPVIATGGALEIQASGPPVNDTEMACRGQSWADIADKIGKVKPLARAQFIPDDMKAAIAASLDSYPRLFQKAFLDNSDVTPAKIVMAIATHERRLTSDLTPWDRFNAGEATALSPAQQRGLALFNTKARCNVCHQPPLFSDAAKFAGQLDVGTSDGFHNLGFLDPSLDVGRGDGRMKTPTLRNAALRAKGGLLHNGTGNGATFETVVTAYQAGGQVETKRDPLMQKLDLTAAETADLLDFLKGGLTDPRVQDEQPPFDRPLLGSEPIR